MNTSAILRVKRFSWVKNRFFATCWVMVLPPWSRLRVRRSWTAARRMAMGSMPLCCAKRWSSTATTASRYSGGNWSMGV